ncbi:MAG: hypothetical protein RL026_2032 [Pseudomonadota bacterium]
MNPHASSKLVLVACAAVAAAALATPLAAGTNAAAIAAAQREREARETQADYGRESRGNRPRRDERQEPPRPASREDRSRREAWHDTPRFQGRDDHWRDYRPVPRPARHAPPPRQFTRLPSGHRHYDWNGARWYHYRGSWYQPYGNRYVVVGAPYGLYVSVLPSYHTTFWFGGTRYFFADDIYYTYEPARRGYVVTRSPYARDEEEQGESRAAVAPVVYVYPTQGQSEQQQADDRYACHRWAVDQSGYDPTVGSYDPDRRAEYDRAQTACLTGRGYSVR